jgi:hypothetical protein
MRALALVGTFAAGLILGALTLVASSHTSFPAVQLARGDAATEPLPTKELGAVLMRRVAEGFVHAGRSWHIGGLVFYDTPKPSGSWLCRVNAYVVPPKIVRGRQIRDNEFRDDNLTIEHLHGVWRAPTAAEDPKVTREAACAEYRDFNNLIWERTSGSARRGVYLMDAAANSARSGTTDFPVTCTHFARKPCDGVALLRSLDLKKIRAVEAISEFKREQFSERSDAIEVAVEQPSKAASSEFLRFKITSRQTYGRHTMDEGEVKAVDVHWGAID